MGKVSSTSNKAIRSLSIQTIVTIGLGVIEIVSFSILSRLLSKEDFGYYAAVSAIVAIFAVFSNSGIGAAIIQKKEINLKYLNCAFSLSLFLGLTLSLLLFIFSETIASFIADDSMTLPLMFMSSTLLLNCLTSVNRSLMYKRFQFAKVGIIELVSQTLTAVITILFAVKGFGYYAIIAKSVLYSFLTYLLTSLIVHVRFRIVFDKREALSIFRFSGWLMASSVFREISAQIDRLMMPNILSVSLLGAYNRPKDFTNQISQKINGIYDTALFPVLSSIQDNRASMQNAYIKSLYYVNIFSTLLSLGLIFNSNLVIRVFFGEQWLSLNVILQIFSIVILFNACGRLADCFLRSLALTKQQFIFRIFEAIIKTASVIICSRWGISGVAIAVVSSDAICKLIKIFYVGIKININSRIIILLFFKSWRFIFVMIPLMVIANILLDYGYINIILNLILFIFVFVVEFVLFPQFVGEEYKRFAYASLMKKFKNILLRI